MPFESFSKCYCKINNNNCSFKAYEGHALFISHQQLIFFSSRANRTLMPTTPPPPPPPPTLPPSSAPPPPAREACPPCPTRRMTSQPPSCECRCSLREVSCTKRGKTLNHHSCRYTHTHTHTHTHTQYTTNSNVAYCAKNRPLHTMACPPFGSLLHKEVFLHLWPAE